MERPFPRHIFFLLFLFLSFQLLGIFPIKINETTEAESGSAVLPPVLIQALASGSLPQVFAGYCQLGQSTVTFTNQGTGSDPVASQITNLSLGIALGDAFLLSENAFEVTGIRIAGKNLTGIAPLNQLNGNPLFASDPDGPGGLSDLDGDGFFDDLPLGASVEITAFYRFDCNMVSGISNSCLNNVGTKLSARMAYVEQNGAAPTFELKDYLKPSNTNTALLNFADPDAFLGVDTFFVTHRETRSLRFFGANCAGGGQLIARVALPTGISPQVASTTFLKNGNIPVPLLSAQVNNDTLVLTYNAGFSNLLSGDYDLRLAFTADCSAALGPTTFPFSLEHFCSPCSCRHRWFCGTIEGPQLHATAPPCPTSVLLSCDKGIQTKSFEVERTTFGFADPAMTTAFSPTAANRKVALGCDSVEMRVLSTVGSTSLNDSIGVVVTYSNPNGTTSPVEVFQFHRASVRFTHAGNEYDCPVSPNELTVTDVGGMKTLTFDLNSCLSGLGFALTEGDTVDFVGEFVVNPDGPFGSFFTLVPELRAYAFATLSGQNFACDNFGDLFRLGRGRASFDFPSPTESQVQGCQSGELRFKLFVPDNDFSDFFGNEFRASSSVDSFVLDFDPQLLSVYGNVEVEVSIPGHTQFGNSYFPIRPLSDFPNGHYVAKFDTLAHVPTLNLIDQYTFDLVLRPQPSCLSAQSGNFVLTSKIHYQDRVYATIIGDGSCAVQKTELGSSLLTYSNPPVLALTSQGPSTVTVQNSIAEWTLDFCNSSPTATSSINWLAIGDGNGQLTIQSLENVTDPSNPVPFVLIPYPDGMYAFLPMLAPGTCMKLRLRASLDGCESLNFDLRSGWNCGPYTQANWNPNLNAPCAEASLPLTLINQIDSPISIDFQQVTSQCEAGGGEVVTLSGQLTASAPLPSDDYTVKFIFDVNGDGQAQAGEPALGQQVITGAIAPGSPLPFGQTLTLTPAQVCQMLVTLETAATVLCEEVMAPMPLPQLQNAGTDVNLCELSGNTVTMALGEESCGSSGYNYFWTSLPPANLSALSNTNVPDPVLSFQWQNLLGQTLTYVLETERADCGLSSFDTVRIHLPLAATSFFENDTTFLQAPNCQALVGLCLNILTSDQPNLQVTDNGLPYPNGAFLTCSGSQVGMQLSAGNHELIATNTVTGCADTSFVSVGCSVTDTIQLDLLLHSTDTICFSSNEILGSIETLSNTCPDSSFVSYEIFEDSCFIVSGNWVGAETACIVACDNVGFCDTTIVQINVQHPFPNGIKDSIVIEQTSQFCFLENQLNIAGPIVSFENLCEGLSGTSVEFTLDSTTNCLSYFGINQGVDTACIRLCDASGNCDTVNVCVSVIPGNVIYDTVFISVDTNIYCLSDTLLPGNIVLVEDICPELNGDEVQFTIDELTNCISYWGPAVGQDTACIRFEDDLGNVGLVNLIVTVVRTVPATICDTIFVNQVKALCLDTLELPGNFTYIQEICPDVRTGNADVFIDPVTLCIIFEGLMEGKDSTCIIVCDDFGFCDTTYLCFTVAPYFELPALGNDTAFTPKATPVVLDFLANDTLFGGITNIYILDPPISGTAILNLDNSFTYTPDDPFCARWDNFTYVACNPNGCDTATVSVFIECIELTVFSAVSPNNDGVNDVFFIAKIEDFPDNRLWVYNRWGNLVFDRREYENNWPGTWGEEIDLPDGTYYYILEWSDGGATTIQRGYFEMFR